MIEEEPAMLPLMYEYPFDFTEYSDILESQKKDLQPTQALADVLKEVTGDPWTTEPKKKYTLYKAKVSYVGANLMGYPTSKRYKYVLFITLSARYKNKAIYLVFNKLS